jgi:hypothetical protein
MLRDQGTHVPDRHWFVGTVSRRKVKANAEFARLMGRAESGQVGTAYIESQDRWGTADRPELFALLGALREHGRRLYDLRVGKDLTERDLATEMLAFVNSIKSENKLKDISYRSHGTGVNNFEDSGSQPTGTHPYDYGKRCSTADGWVLWEWHPVNRSRGQPLAILRTRPFLPGGNGRNGQVSPQAGHAKRITGGILGWLGSPVLVLDVQGAVLSPTARQCLAWIQASRLTRTTP